VSDKRRSPMDAAFRAQIGFSRPTVTKSDVNDAWFALRKLEEDAELQERHDLCRTWFYYGWQAAQSEMKAKEADRE